MIPDAALRDDALVALATKRGILYGAGLLCTLPKRRIDVLLRLIIAYDIAADYLDEVSERNASRGIANGRRLHIALVDALDAGGATPDYYEYQAPSDDGGYLRALVECCREHCGLLPSYATVAPVLIAAASLTQVQAINHEPDSRLRNVELGRWVASELPAGREVEWFEQTAAASGWLTVIALLALAGEPARTLRHAREVYDAYMPWIAAATTMLDSCVDSVDDAERSAHSYIAHYPSRVVAIKRVCALIERATRQARGLEGGDGHSVIVASMVAMYLVEAQAKGSLRPREWTKLTEAGGIQVKLLIPAVKLWHRFYGARGDPGGARLHGEPSGAGSPPGSRLPSPVQTLYFWQAPVSYLRRARARHGSCFTLRAVGHPPLVFLSDPGDVAELLLAPVDELSPAGGGGPILPIVGERSFMLEEGEEHQIGRLVALGAFSQRAVQAHTDAVAAVLDRGLRSLPTEVPVALHPRLRELTLEVVLRRIFGDGIDEETIMLLRERILAMLEITASVTLTKNLMRHGPGRRTWERFLTARDDVDELVYGLIEKRGDPREHGEGDALDRLLAARNADGSRLSRRQLRDNVISLVLAGHETTASQLAWAFQLLAHHPRVQARLVEEIDRGESGEYLDATILEVLRHRPVFLFTIPRAVMREGVWIGGWTFGPPAQLLGCIYLIHHDPVLYPEPDVFSPERFLGEPPGGDAWIPWGGARRRCPGRHMALFEMKTILRGILSRMNVEPASRQMERPRWRSVIVTPHAGSRVILRPRVRAARVTHPTPVATAGQESRAFFYSEN